MSAFESIPTLSLAEARAPDTKSTFLEKLRYALVYVGFLYLEDTGVSRQLLQDTIAQCRAFFDELSDEDKMKIEMKNVKSFLGYSHLGNELTAGGVDWREQLDLATTHELPRENDPPWYNLMGPNQWPDASKIPQFRPVYEEFLREMSAMAIEFTSLVAEAVGLDPDAFLKFFETDQSHKLKLIKYPDSGAGTGQGCGPHKDRSLATYLLQPLGPTGLQVQNSIGKWIDCPPREYAFVVNIGQGLEALTDGVCIATTHRVLSPQQGGGPRYSIPFFQRISFDTKFEAVNIPDSVRALKQTRDERGDNDIEYTFVKGKWSCLGEATLMNRIKSHVDVSERWYPDLLARIRMEEGLDSGAREIVTPLLND